MQTLEDKNYPLKKTGKQSERKLNPWKKATKLKNKQTNLNVQHSVDLIERNKIKRSLETALTCILNMISKNVAPKKKNQVSWNKDILLN